MQTIYEMTLGEDGLVRLVYLTDAEGTLATAEASVAEMARLTGGKKAPLLADIRGLKSATQECRQYYVGPEANRIALAVALLGDSPVSKVLGNFYLAVNQPLFPCRLFTSEAEATDWLKGFCDER
jgi:hypothetical protein